MISTGELRKGVVIRGEAPVGKPRATAGKLELPTRFVFGTEPRPDAIDVGERLTLVLESGEVHLPRRQGDSIWRAPIICRPTR